MSLIASFYLIPLSKADGLIAAAEAHTAALATKRWGVFGPKLPLDPDPFWDYLSANTRELEDFPYSGTVLVDVELLAPEAFNSNHPLGKRLSDKDSAYMSYAPAEANAAIDVLAEADLSRAAVEDFLRREGRDDDVSELLDALLDARRRMIAWLQAVTDEELGLLTNG